MANDHLFVGCTICRKAVAVAKFFPGYTTLIDDERQTKALVDFINEHGTMHSGIGIEHGLAFFNDREIPEDMDPPISPP